ncbi:MAG TPA: tetratricopeptide repeat protein [Gemmatimonadaceae bacterium]|nr:tetratricopeptide repeat protein [Gemmatimonadaceae bacterium]
MRAERAGALDRAADSFAAAVEASDDPAVRSEALRHLADVHRTRCLWDRALDFARQAQQVAAVAGLEQHRVEAVNAEVNILITRGDFPAAIPKLEAVARADVDPRLRGIALQNLGSILAQTGQQGAAARAFRESLGCFQAADYTRGQGIALNNLGRLMLDTGDAPEARPLLEAALAAARAVEDNDLVALVSLNLASVLCASGENEGAQDLAMSALGYFSQCDNRYREIECLRLIGDINVRCEDIANAERCYDLSLRLAEEIGADVEARLSRDRLRQLQSSSHRSHN